MADMTPEQAKEYLAQQEEAIKKRKERFGVVESKENEDEKIEERKERFGIMTKEEIASKLEERKKRFGGGEISAEAQELIDKRKERFKDAFDKEKEDKEKTNADKPKLKLRMRRKFIHKNRRTLSRGKGLHSKFGGGRRGHSFGGRKHRR